LQPPLPYSVHLPFVLLNQRP